MTFGNDEGNLFYLNINEDLIYYDIRESGTKLWTFDQFILYQYDLLYSDYQVVQTGSPIIFTDETYTADQSISDVRLSPDEGMIVHSIDNTLIIRDSQTLESLYTLQGDEISFEHTTLYEKRLFEVGGYGSLVVVTAITETTFLFLSKRRSKRLIAKNAKKELYPEAN